MSDFRQQLLGTWAVIRAELGSESMPPEAAARVEIEFDAESAYRVRFAGEISDSGSFQLLAQTERDILPHRRITLHGEHGTNAKRTFPGIFQLRGDRLKLCLALEGDAPPTAFTSSNATTGTPHYLVTYRRKV